MLELKLLNSLAKVWPDKTPDECAVTTGGSMLLNEKYHFQVAYRLTDRLQAGISLRCESDLGDALTVRFVDNVPCDLPVPAGFEDVCEHPLPGLMPDILRPLPPVLWSYSNIWRAVWITVDAVRCSVAPGEHVIGIVLNDGAEARAEFRLNVIDFRLPDQTLPVTNWFHSDALCNYYGVKFASEEYWRIMENFVKTAVSNGINAILTPVFTPPLDTAPGTERLTTQLVKVTVLPEGGYGFDFGLLDRYISICIASGAKYLEISHLFTQWGCRNAPKVMGTLLDGSEMRLFGWETDGTGEEYSAFLRAFLSALTAFLKERGIFGKCFFHVSDEPDWTMRERYAKGAAVVREFVPEEMIIDAISEPEFYMQGLIRTPVACLTSIDRFIDAHIDRAWGYYCCGQIRTSNRLIATPSYRNRILGFQLFRYDIKGFLQWGYNFYNSHLSLEQIDPFGSSTAGGWVPGGDPYVVYPGPDGRPWESIRLVVFDSALADYRALTALLEKGVSGNTRDEISRLFGLDKYPISDFKTSGEEIIAIREKVNSLLCPERIQQ
ncbi:MAG: DUF4091 domain-containing protein [Clostridia bacterium]|nr:DUF4091 domain-containing protein [Clostridia bacterium]